MRVYLSTLFYLKNFFNFPKKSVDKGKCMWYITQAVSERGTAMYLENWTMKETAYANKHQKRVLNRNEKVSVYKRFFWELESESIRYNHGKPCLYTIYWEFDPGSGWTLAACLTHASRTKHCWWRFVKIDFDLVADGWVMREQPAFQRGTTVGNDC